MYSDARATPLWHPAEPAAYAYLLGIYLGDGCITVSRSGSVCLLVSMDSAYRGIIAEVEASMRILFPSGSVRAYLRADRSNMVVRLRDRGLLPAFPQHGAGRKHQRRIALTPWQRGITEAHPRPLLRGLIHSDGCRTVNRFRTRLPSGRVAEYEYPRYFFSNLSADIRGIFCAHCDCSASAGRGRTRATSRCRTATASPCSTPSSGISPSRTTSAQGQRRFSPR